MSLAQTYRNQAAQQQNRRLMLYVLLAASLHGIAGIALGFWQTHLRHAFIEPLDQPTPIDFVYIEPSAQVAPPANPVKRSQANALAGPASSNRPVQSSAQAAAPQTIAPQTVAPQTGNPSRPTRSTAVLPAPVAPSSRTQARPALVRPSPVQPSPAAAASETAPINSASDLRTTRPAAPAASTAAPASQTGSPTELYSLSVESGGSAAELSPGLSPSGLSPNGLSPNGLQGQLNPNRSGSGTAVDAAQDPWGGYLASLNRAIDRNWQRVSVAATSRTRIQFRVNQAGEVFDLHLLEPSGNRLADEAALQAVRAAAPFAPLPPNAEQVLIVNFTFTQWLGNDPP